MVITHFLSHTLLLWVPFFVVVVVEHLVLTRVYGKPSSLQRIFGKPTASTKTDLIVWAFHYVGIPVLKLLGRFVPVLSIVTYVVAVPGLTYLGVTALSRHLHWQGLLQNIFPASGLFAVLAWLVVHDFSLYVSHILMHRVPVLWRFHRLHHAATEMNVITGSRVSLGENALNELGVFLLLTVIIDYPRPETIFSVLLIRRLIDLVQHSDLPFDYGVAGYVVASPRFHRMHHSSERCDHDANYGNIFSIWDYLFGTVSGRYRASSATADECPLGLDRADETEQVNGNWQTALLQGTLVDEIATIRRWASGMRQSNKGEGLLSRPGTEGA